MAEFPAGTFAPREKENLSGVVYDPDNKKKLFVEDIQSIEDELVAVQNYTLRSVVNTPATINTMTIEMTARIIRCTPTGPCTFNASGGVAGQLITFLFYNNNTTSKTMTFGTNFIKQSVLQTGTAAGKYFAITFLCLDGTTWFEVNRTTSMS